MYERCFTNKAYYFYTKGSSGEFDVDSNIQSQVWAQLSVQLKRMCVCVTSDRDSSLSTYCCRARDVQAPPATSGGCKHAETLAVMTWC